jgi:16S rRNA processing protein RimM
VEAVRGTRLVVDVPADEQPGDAEEFYDRQLVGLRVLDADGTAAGEVVAVVHLPAQDALEVLTESGSRLIPFVTDLVPVVDLQAGHVRLADVPGLLSDIEEAGAPDAH